MSCEDLEPLISIGQLTNRRFPVTRHRRDCGTVIRSMASKYSGCDVMNESTFTDRRKRYYRAGKYRHLPQDHSCMERWKLHLALAEGGVM